MHRSLVQPNFYREIIKLPRRKVIYFFLFMLACSSFVASLSNTWYLMYGKNSIPRTLSKAFPGITIRNGMLNSPSDSPYSPPPYLIFDILNQITPSVILNSEENIVPIIVDPYAGDTITSQTKLVVFLKRGVKLHLNATTSYEIPYERILKGEPDFSFTPGGILSYLKRRIVKILAIYFLFAALQDCSMFLFSIFFLAIAAFIFRIDRDRKFKEYLKTAVFAISPLVLGGILISISGVKIQWVWHILILLSTVVMFRAIVALGNDATSSGDNK